MMKPYKFPVKRRGAAVPEQARLPQQDRPDPEVLTLIQGHNPGSKEEWRVAMALDKLGLEYQYQVPVAGGRRLRGGGVLDFLVEMPPEQVPMPVHGRYWHPNPEEERLYLEMLERIYHRKPVILWDYELTSIQASVNVIRRELFL